MTAPETGSAPPEAVQGHPFARIRRTLAAIYALLVILLVVASVRIVVNARESGIEAVRRNNQMLARVLEEHVARTFGEVDKVLQGAAEQFAARGGLQKFDEKTVHESLRRRQASLPQTASIGAVLPSGRMLARAADYPIRPADLSDREDFVFFRENPVDTAFIGATGKNPFAPGQLIHLSRRIALPDGRSGGILRGAIASEYLTRFYAELQLPPDTVIALVKPDGNPVFRHPHVDDLQQFNVSKTDAFREGRPAGRMGVFLRKSPLDGGEHLVAYRWFADASLGVFVGTPTEVALAAGRAYALRVAAGALLVAIVFAALFGLIFRNLRRQESLSAQQRATEMALRESEAKYRALADNLPQGVFYKDLESRYLAANRKYAEDTGIAPEDFVGRDDYAFHSRELAEKYRQDDRQVMASGRILEVDESYVRKGEMRFAHTIKTPVRDENGRVIGVCGIYSDITERHRLEQRVKESEATLRAIYECAQEGILVTDKMSNRFTMANPAMCRMLGYREDELLALAPQDLHSPEALPEVEEIFRSMQQGRFFPVHELPFRRKDGGTIYMDASPTPFSIDGRPAFLGVFRDVTEQRQAREALRESEARLNEAQRLARIGSWELDLATGALHWSDEIFRIFEIDPEQFAASYQAFLALVHPSDRDRVDAAYRLSVEQRSAYDITHRLLFPDGRVKHVRERGETRYADDSTPLRSIGTVQDVTEQVLAEQEIRALNDSLERRVATRTAELEQANRELESFSYSVSHDLRAPLRAINGFSSILQDSEALKQSAESRDLLGRIVRNTKRMSDLIDDILDYSRASQTALSRKEVDLTSLARVTWDEHAPSYPSASAQIGELGFAWGDPVMLRQVFDNLVSNALKYSSKRENALIEIGSREENGGTAFFVRDNGAGFDMQYAGKLFGMFQRMHTDRDFPAPASAWPSSSASSSATAGASGPNRRRMPAPPSISPCRTAAEAPLRRSGCRRRPVGAARPGSGSAPCRPRAP